MTVPFSKPTKRAALLRSGGKCEAVGEWYGLPVGHRCDAPLSYGLEFDHHTLHANSKDNSLENCAAVCIKCHKWKSTKYDTPLAAKTVRQSDKRLGIRKLSTFPGARNSRWKRRVDGTVVLR